MLEIRDIIATIQQRKEWHIKKKEEFKKMVEEEAKKGIFLSPEHIVEYVNEMKTRDRIIDELNSLGCELMDLEAKKGK